MSPSRATAAARVDEVAPPRRATGPARLRPAESKPGRLVRASVVLRSGNLLGRVGTLTAIALFVAVFGVVVFQAFLVQGQARLDHLNSQIDTERQTSQQLEVQLAQLDSPARIVTAARALGMIDAGDVVYLQPAASDDGAARYTAPATTVTTPTTTATTATTVPVTTTVTTPTTTATTATTVPVTTTVTTPTTGSTTVTTVKAPRP